jgi:hypothetical protein
LGDSSIRIIPTAEPERPVRFSSMLLATAVLLAIVAGASYWLRERVERPPALQATLGSAPPVDALAAEPPPDASVPQFTTSLRPLTDQGPDIPSERAPVVTQTPAPDAQPRFAVSLPPTIEQLRSDVIGPAAQTPPNAEPPPIPTASPKPWRNTQARLPAPLVTPSHSSDMVNF